jgi:hypothetical protein
MGRTASKMSSLFDHFDGASEQRLWNVEAEECAAAR